jgi:hypothetical protein
MHPGHSETHSTMYGSPATNQEIPQKEEDTEEVASFLLSLKHNRSVTPEPAAGDDSDERHRNVKKPTPFKPYGHTYGYTSLGTQPKVADRTPPATEKRPVPTNTEAQSLTSNADIDIDYDALIAESSLVFPKDRTLLPDSLYVAMAQMNVCHLTQADRVGCYKSREIGFVGMSCKHCGGQPGFGRYYPNSVRSLAQTTTSQTILKHIGSKCRVCPPHIREAVVELQRQQAIREGMASGRPRYGSRKIFFQRVWARLHGGAFTEEDDDNSNQSPNDLDEERSTLSSSTPDTAEEDADATPAKRKNRFGLLPTQKNKRMKVAGSGTRKHLFTP